MPHQFSRTELAIGPEGLEVMKNSTVAVLGIGGGALRWKPSPVPG